MNCLRAAVIGLVPLAMAATSSRADTTLVNDGFEGYAAGILDKNAAGSANPAPNGSGNPWWGPGTTPNLYVVGNENGVTPHGGSQMIRGSSAAGDHSLGWQNLGYRYNAGSPIGGNLKYDFWFYDPNGATNGSQFESNSAVAYYGLDPSDTDYPSDGSSLSGSAVIERLQLGASNYESGTYDSTKYQARITGLAGGYKDPTGWFNTTLTRSVGWHHGEITIGAAAGDGSNPVSFYLDNMTTPLFSGTTVIDHGYNVLEFTQEGSATGYFDDATLVSTPEPGSACLLGGAMILLARRGRRRGSRAVNQV